MTEFTIAIFTLLKASYCGVYSTDIGKPSLECSFSILAHKLADNLIFRNDTNSELSPLGKQGSAIPLLRKAFSPIAPSVLILVGVFLCCPLYPKVNVGEYPTV